MSSKDINIIKKKYYFINKDRLTFIDFFNSNLKYINNLENKIILQQNYFYITIKFFNKSYIISNIYKLYCNNFLKRIYFKLIFTYNINIKNYLEKLNIYVIDSVISIDLYKEKIDRFRNKLNLKHIPIEFENNICCICLDRNFFLIRENLCGHSYHKKCINKVLVKICPLCRQDLKKKYEIFTHEFKNKEILNIVIEYTNNYINTEPILKIMEINNPSYNLLKIINELKVIKKTNKILKADFIYRERYNNFLIDLLKFYKISKTNFKK